LKSVIEQVIASHQSITAENEQFRKSIGKLNHEKQETIEDVKKQYEKQKQKDLVALKEFIVQVKFIFA
jgi:hypothetical protein